MLYGVDSTVGGVGVRGGIRILRWWFCCVRMSAPRVGAGGVTEVLHTDTHRYFCIRRNQSTV